MAVDYWPKQWLVQIQGNGAQQIKDRVRSAQLGDGYKQQTAEGVNGQSLELPLVYSGKNASAVRDWLKRHVTTPFAYTPPHGELGLYQVQASSIQYVPLNDVLGTVSCTLETSYGYLL